MFEVFLLLNNNKLHVMLNKNKKSTVYVNFMQIYTVRNSSTCSI